MRQDNTMYWKDLKQVRLLAIKLDQNKQGLKKECFLIRQYNIQIISIGQDKSKLHYNFF